MTDDFDDEDSPWIACSASLRVAFMREVRAIAKESGEFRKALVVWKETPPGSERTRIFALLLEFVASEQENWKHAQEAREFIARLGAKADAGELNELRLSHAELNRRHAWLLERFAGISQCKPHEIAEYVGDSVRQYAEIVDPSKPSPWEEAAEQLTNSTKSDQ